MRDVWFTSDQHYGHRKIIEHCGRPFADLHEMHVAMTERHNARVRDGDRVYHLGDFSLDERMVRRYLGALRGAHYLVVGNHDRCHPCHRRSENYRRRYLANGFAWAGERLLMNAFFPAELGHVLATHMPPHATDERYPEYRPDPGEADVFLHGHVHEKWRVRRGSFAGVEGLPPAEPLMVNVGVDVWGFAPVHLDELVAVMRAHAPG